MPGQFSIFNRVFVRRLPGHLVVDNPGEKSRGNWSEEEERKKVFHMKMRRRTISLIFQFSILLFRISLSFNVGSSYLLLSPYRSIFDPPISLAFPMFPFLESLSLPIFPLLESPSFPFRNSYLSFFGNPYLSLLQCSFKIDWTPVQTIVTMPWFKIIIRPHQTKPNYLWTLNSFEPYLPLSFSFNKQYRKK